MPWVSGCETSAPAFNSNCTACMCTRRFTTDASTQLGQSDLFVCFFLKHSIISRAKYWTKKDRVWNGHGADSETGNVSARQEHWIVGRRRTGVEIRSWFVIGDQSSHRSSAFRLAPETTEHWLSWSQVSPGSIILYNVKLFYCIFVFALLNSRYVQAACFALAIQSMRLISLSYSIVDNLMCSLNYKYINK